MEKYEITFEDIKKLLIEEHYQDCPERLEDVEVTFEYLVGSFFPKIMDNIKAEINRQYTLGYVQGFEEGKNNAN